MSKRNIEKHILMNKAEAQDLQKKAKRACLSAGGLIRLLLRGYEPREKPDERFYDVMRELSAIGHQLSIARISWRRGERDVPEPLFALNGLDLVLARCGVGKTFAAAKAQKIIMAREQIASNILSIR